MSALSRSRWLFAVLLLSPEVRAAQLEGVVLGHDGPVGDVRVTAWALPFNWGLEALRGLEQERAFARDAGGRAHVVASARTAKDGHFVLVGLVEGAQVTLWADAGARGQVLLEGVGVAKGVALKVQLGDAHLLDGTALVRGVPGYPYPYTQAGLEVVAVHTRVPLLLRGKTDDRGNFSLGHVPAGDYLVLGVGPHFAPARSTVSLPLPPPKPKPKPAPPPAEEESSLADAIARPPAPPQRLGRPDEDYHHGAVFLSFLDTTSMTGIVTNHGKPVRGATVRLASGPDEVTSRTTDAAGRFRFTDTVLAGTNYGLEASDGTHTYRDCVTLNVEVGGSWCCATRPTTRITDVPGEPLSCALRVSLDADAGSLPQEPCPCDATVLEAFTTDAGP